MPSIISNASNTPLNQRTGTIPDVSGALQDWFQPLMFDIVTKQTVAFQVVETLTPYSFRGVIQPFTDRQLQMKPEGQRSWTWLEMYAEPNVKLDTDDLVIFNGVHTRVMSRTDYSLYGYVRYSLVQDWTA